MTRNHQQTPVTDLPGFRESLRLLVEREQYSGTDIGLMFGITRERVRQLCERFGLPTRRDASGLFAVRVWDDAANRFQPVSRGAFTRQQRSANSAVSRAERQQQRAARRAEIVLAASALRVPGREPSWGEIWVAIGGVPGVRSVESRILSFWRDKHAPTSREGRLATIAALGFAPRETRGEVKRLTGTCNRGHVMTPENTYQYHERRFCRACVRRRRAVKS